MESGTSANRLSDRQAREANHHDAMAAQLDPATMPPGPPDEWEQALIDRAGDVRGKRVLELGCGNGGLSLALLERGAELTAIDISPRMVEVARARAEHFAPGADGARFIAASAEDTSLESGAFDLVLGKWILHHLDLDRAAAEVERVLAPRGRALFVESSALNPLLGWARRHVAGHFRVASYGTPDEHPLRSADFRGLAERFGWLWLDFPNFWLVQMLDRHLLRGAYPGATRACRRADSWLARRFPGLRRYGYWVLLEARLNR